MKMGATCSLETSVDFQRTTWRYIPEGITFFQSWGLFRWNPFDWPYSLVVPRAGFIWNVLISFLFPNFVWNPFLFIACGATSDFIYLSWAWDLLYCFGFNVVKTADSFRIQGVQCWQFLPSGNWTFSHFWHISLRRPLKTNRRFGGTCLNHLGRRISQTKTSVKQAATYIGSFYSSTLKKEVTFLRSVVLLSTYYMALYGAGIA
jgi:hypothetical protein